MFSRRARLSPWLLPLLPMRGRCFRGGGTRIDASMSPRLRTEVPHVVPGCPAPQLQWHGCRRGACRPIGSAVSRVDQDGEEHRDRPDRVARAGSAALHSTPDPVIVVRDDGRGCLLREAGQQRLHDTRHRAGAGECSRGQRERTGSMSTGNPDGLAEALAKLSSEGVDALSIA